MKEGWTYKTLGQLSSITAGQGAPQGEDNYCHDGTPFIKAANLVDLVKGYSEYSFQQVSDQTAKKFRLKLFRAGSVIFAKSGMSCMKGWVYVLKNDCYVVSHLAVVSPNGINSRFLHYYLQFSRPNSLVKDAAFPSISLKDIENLIVPDLPKEEQEEIVERLDAAFAQIDELKSNAEKQLAEARALFQSALTQAMQPKPGWQEKRIKEIADVKGGKRVPKGYKLQSTKTNHPYIRVADFNNYGTIEMSDIQYISDDIFEQIKNYTITDKDLYVSIAGTIGKTGIIPSKLNGANLTENACKLVFKEDINLRFVYLFTLSEIFKKQVEKATKQASQPKLALTRLAEIKMSIPSISEQQTIVAQLDALSNRIRDLEEISRKTAAECDALTQALLRQIFE